MGVAVAFGVGVGVAVGVGVGVDVGVGVGEGVEVGVGAGVGEFDGVGEEVWACATEIVVIMKAQHKRTRRKYGFFILKSPL